MTDTYQSQIKSITSDDSSLRVEVRELRKQFKRTGGGTVEAIGGVDLDVYPDEIVVLLGPSGCGKSTLLRCIAGLEEPDTGFIRIGGATVFDASTAVPANERDVNMMFQSYALWPHMTLEDNVAYPLQVEGAVSKKVARGRAKEYLELVGLEGLGQQYPGSVSGGQQQRVALARTLINEPSVVLFDEPLSNVDAKVRANLRAELLRIHRKLQFAAVYVTHDQIEALGLGTRIAVMRMGTVEQVADPVTIYEDPATRYAAEFVGEANLLPAVLKQHDSDTTLLSTAFGELEMLSERFEKYGTLPTPGTEVLVLVRPEHCRLVSEKGEDGPNRWSARVDTTMYAGSRTEYVCTTEAGSWQVWEWATASPASAGTEVQLIIPRDAVRVVEMS